MNDIREMTAHNTPTAIGEGQSLHKCTENSIDDWETDFNSSNKSFDELQRELLLSMDKSYLKIISMSELYETSYESKESLIDGLLNVGTYLFVGAPKIGKSFLMAQLAYHVSTGTALWDYKVHKGTVLYLALEDDYRRLQERLYRMVGTESSEKLFFSVSAGQLGKGLDEQLNRFVREHSDTRLIIIDTLHKIREVGGNNYSYANDYDIITRLKQFADANKICLLLVHHTRKQNAEDKFDMISGTNGLLGAADGAFLLTKEKRTSNMAALEISGRDQQDQRLHLIRNESTLAWELSNKETELWKEPPEPILDEIAKRITENNPVWIGSPTELVEYLGLDMRANALTLKLNVNAGRLLREYSIRYDNKRCHDGRKVRLALVTA